MFKNTCMGSMLLAVLLAVPFKTALCQQTISDCIQICLVENPGKQGYCRQCCETFPFTWQSDDPSVRDCIQICLIENPGQQAYCRHACEPSLTCYPGDALRNTSSTVECQDQPCRLEKQRACITSSSCKCQSVRSRRRIRCGD